MLSDACLTDWAFFHPRDCIWTLYKLTSESWAKYLPRAELSRKKEEEQWLHLWTVFPSIRKQRQNPGKSKDQHVTVRTNSGNKTEWINWLPRQDWRNVFYCWAESSEVHCRNTQTGMSLWWQLSNEQGHQKTRLLPKGPTWATLPSCAEPPREDTMRENAPGVGLG